MKKKLAEPELTVKVNRREWEMTLEGEAVLRCVLTWPECVGTWRGLKDINRYYDRVLRVWQKRWEREVYIRACLDLADRRAQRRPFKVWCARLDTHITLQEGGLLSLWQEGTEHWGFDRPVAVRRGDTWSLSEGAPRTLASFFSGQRGWKRRLLGQVERQVEERLAGGESLLDPDCVHRLRREFDPDNFYLTGDGVQVFFPLYALAPGGEGVPAFSVELPQE